MCAAAALHGHACSPAGSMVRARLCCRAPRCMQGVLCGSRARVGGQRSGTGLPVCGRRQLCSPAAAHGAEAAPLARACAQRSRPSRCRTNHRGPTACSTAPTLACSHVWGRRQMMLSPAHRRMGSSACRHGKEARRGVRVGRRARARPRQRGHALLSADTADTADRAGHARRTPAGAAGLAALSAHPPSSARRAPPLRRNGTHHSIGDTLLRGAGRAGGPARLRSGAGRRAGRSRAAAPRAAGSAARAAAAPPRLPPASPPA